MQQMEKLCGRKKSILTPARRGFLIEEENNVSYLYLNIGRAIAKLIHQMEI